MTQALTKIVDELWADIRGYEGLYQISTQGNVKTFYVSKRKSHRSLLGTLLKLKASKGGYCIVSLVRDKRRQSCYVHRLVAETFLVDKKDQVNHINGHKTDNRLRNLQWVTRRENVQHARDKLYTKTIFEPRIGHLRVWKKKVKSISHKPFEKKRWTITELAETPQPITEIWADIIPYRGAYQVSTLGRVRSFRSRYSGGRFAALLKEPHLLVPSTSRGYQDVLLYDGQGERVMRIVHRLVAQAFIPNPSNKPTVNHINGNKLDNRVGNLQWATTLENNLHCIVSGLNNPARGGRIGSSKLTTGQVVQIKKLLARGALCLDVASRFCVSPSLISMIQTGKIWNHVQLS